MKCDHEMCNYMYVLRMDEQFSDSGYRPFAPSVPTAEDELPSRYQSKTKDPEKLARAQARAEARRTRRTMRLQQQKQQQQEEAHYKLTVEGDSSDESSVDENYDVASLTESVHENLT